MVEPRTEVRVYPFRRARLAGYMVFSLFAALIGALFCVVAGSLPPDHVWLGRIGGGLAAVLFGAMFVMLVPRVFGFMPGLVLDHEGIIDNSSFSSVGRIPWSEISYVRTVRPPSVPLFRGGLPMNQIQPPRFLVLDVRDPERFIQQAGFLKRWLLRATAKNYGSPVTISPFTVHIDTDDLAHYIRQIVLPS